MEFACEHCGARCSKRGGGIKPTHCMEPECRKAFNRKRMKALNERKRAETGQSLWSRRYEADRERRNAQRRAWNTSERGSQLRKAAWQRRRAVKRSSGWADRILAAEVYERDGWTCGICARPVDPALPYPDPMSASLDHIVPLSLGGGHTHENTRCSHLTCNVRRGNRVA